MVSAKELIDAWVRMWNSYDLDEVSRLFVGDCRLTYLSSEKEGVLSGFDTILAHHRGFGFMEGGKVTGNRLWIEGLVYSDFGDAAVAAGTWLFRRASGQVQRGPVTFVCVRESGEYRLAHLNFGNYPSRP
ncbi:MAG: DUF4440 domain-containing protein [Bacillota bacterium]|nr:DUF4440 domain-containing protein [Bacillota bacterium]